jgi:hypothetical protein
MTAATESQVNIAALPTRPLKTLIVNTNPSTTQKGVILTSGFVGGHCAGDNGGVNSVPAISCQMRNVRWRSGQRLPSSAITFGNRYFAIMA